MNILVGVAPDDAGDDGLALAAVLTRLTGARLVLAHVYPPPYEFPSLTAVDAEWRAFIEERAEAVVQRAREVLARDWKIDDADTIVAAHTSRGRGLLALIEQVDARIVVIGPAPGGDKGHVSLGSISDRLLHGSSAAVALAPEGYRDTAPDDLERIVVGFRSGEESEQAIRTALRLAGDGDQPTVEILTLVLRPTRIVGARTRKETEQAMVDLMTQRAEAEQRSCLDSLGQPHLRARVVRGDTTGRALSRFDWHEGDLLCLASSTDGPVHRVVLGDMTHKILRNSDVPAVVLPRAFELRSEDAS